MKKVLNGVQDMNFTTENGEVIDGVKLHYLSKDMNVYGQKADSKFVKRDVLKGWGISIEDLKSFINEEIDIDYNEKGAICGINV